LETGESFLAGVGFFNGAALAAMGEVVFLGGNFLAAFATGAGGTGLVTGFCCFLAGGSGFWRGAGLAFAAGFFAGASFFATGFAFAGFLVFCAMDNWV
jgi:hypothetical protein